MKTLVRALCVVLVCAAFAIALPSRATGTLPPPPVPHPDTARLFVTAQNGSAVAYAWRDSGGVFVYNGPQHTYPRPTTHRPSSLALALLTPVTPVAAWRDSQGIHSAIWVDASQQGVTIQYWLTTNYGAGRNPQLLTNPLRLVYFDARGAFTCQEWSGSVWQHGCEA